MQDLIKVCALAGQRFRMTTAEQHILERVGCGIKSVEHPLMFLFNLRTHPIKPKRPKSVRTAPGAPGPRTPCFRT
jgi:hypothetical protein